MHNNDRLRMRLEAHDSPGMFLSFWWWVNRGQK